jgi:hypothetical protein
MPEEEEEINYRVHNSLAFVFILSQINPAHILPSNFFKVNFNIIFLSTPSSCRWPLAFRFTRQNSACLSLLPTRVTCPYSLMLTACLSSAQTAHVWSRLHCRGVTRPTNKQWPAGHLLPAACYVSDRTKK